MDIRYVAGLFDGEGWIRIQKWKKPNSIHIRYQLYGGISMCNEEIIDLLHEQFDGSKHHQNAAKYNPNAREAWKWIIASQTAATFLRKVKPHLIVKADQAHLALQFQHHMDTSRNNRATYDERMAIRERFYLQLSAMKRQDISTLPN